MFNSEQTAVAREGGREAEREGGKLTRWLSLCLDTSLEETSTNHFLPFHLLATRF